MKNENINRLLSGFLSLALVLPVFGTLASAQMPTDGEYVASNLIANADINETFKDSKEFANKVNSDLQILEEKYFDIANISLENVDSSGDITYKHESSDGLVSFLDLKDTSDDVVTIHFSEGNFEDTVTYMSDGRVFLDGNEVTVNSIQPFAGFVSSFEKSAPRGTTASQYTGSEMLYDSCASITFAYKIVDYGITALGAAIAAKFGGTWGAAASIAVSEKLAGDLVAYLKSKDPNATSISFKDYRQALQPQDSLEPKYKHNVYFYSKVNYGGTKSLAYNYYETRIAT